MGMPVTGRAARLTAVLLSLKNKCYTEVSLTLIISRT